MAVRIRRYNYLQQKMAEYGIDRPYLAEQLECSPSCIGRRFMAYPRCTWTSEEQYKIMDMINEPYSRLHIVFPKDGISDPSAITAENITLAEFMTRLMAGTTQTPAVKRR